MRRLLAGLSVMASLATLPGRVVACPACNIHNYLTASVCSSKNIYIGKVLKAADEEHATVEVVAVIRGDHKKTSVVTVRLWHPTDYVGKAFIFSDPACDDPNFDTLPLACEDEVRFLAGFGFVADEMKRLGLSYGVDVHAPPNGIAPVIKDIDEAIRRACDLSNESRKMGVEYLQKMRVFPSSKITEAIDRELAEPEPSSYHIACLMLTLMLRPDANAQQYVLKRVKTLVDKPARPLDWNKIDRFPSTDGALLEASIGAARSDWAPAPYAEFAGAGRKAQDDLLKRIRGLVLDAYPRMGEATMADATYALCATKLVKPEELVALLGKTENKSPFALGMFRVGLKNGRVWAHEEASRALEQARATATQPALKKDVEEILRRKQDVLKKQ
jgi:hypothetical protein